MWNFVLQELETDQFYNFFLPELKHDGYDGIFSPKSRAKTMSESERKFVDGCAIFFRSVKSVSLLLLCRFYWMQILHIQFLFIQIYTRQRTSNWIQSIGHGKFGGIRQHVEQSHAQG